MTTSNVQQQQQQQRLFVKQPAGLPWPAECFAGSALGRGRALAEEAWGEAADRMGGVGAAFLYLWRRFGPPLFGCDGHKDAASYILTTADPQVMTEIRLGGSRLGLGVAFCLDRTLMQQYLQPFAAWGSRYEAWFYREHAALLRDDPEAARARYWQFNDADLTAAQSELGEHPQHWRGECWREGPELVRRVNGAVLETLRELLRPVTVRDCSLNILGPLTYEALRELPPDLQEPAPRSRYAGLGIDRGPLERLLREEREEFGVVRKRKVRRAPRQEPTRSPHVRIHPNGHATLAGFSTHDLGRLLFLATLGARDEPRDPLRPMIEAAGTALRLAEGVANA